MVKENKTTDMGSSDAPQTEACPQRRSLKSHELFAGKREIIIEHAGSEYCLRQTSQGKLLLTK